MESTLDLILMFLQPIEKKWDNLKGIYKLIGATTIIGILIYLVKLALNRG